LLNISDKPLEIHKHFRAFAGALDSIGAIKARIVLLRKKSCRRFR
jgi:hypothetical protein